MKDLLNLEYNQVIIIDKIEYTVIAMLKFIETSSYWIEYILVDEKSGEQYYLDVEPIGKYALHRMIDINLEPELEISYQSELYELFQKGNAKIETYYGYIGAGINDEVEYYEYKCNNKILTIEKWKDTTEISCGKYIEKNSIKIKKVKDDNFRL